MSAAVAIPSHDIVHVCSCRQAYTLPEWLRLRHVGDQRVEAPGLRAYALSCRDCRCGSTRSVRTETEGRTPIRTPDGARVVYIQPAVTL